MKRFKAGVLILMDLVSGAWAGPSGITIPSGYKYIKSVGSGALNVYYKNGVYVSVIDLKKAKINVGMTQPMGNNKYMLYSLKEWWSNIGTKLAIYNGQFFSLTGWPYYDSTTLSFPLRSYWHNINLSKDYGNLKTLRVSSNGSTTIHDGYSSGYMLKYSKELIVGLNPYENKGYYNSTGRFYIAGIPYNSYVYNSYYRNMEYLLFFTAISKTQIEMLGEMVNWNIAQRDIVMMDGSGSVQMKVGSLEVYANGFPKKRKIPNVITIIKKGFKGLS